ncbi:MAG TPA: 50S ribosomal protein L35 [Desulfotomaculum sp.]|nr:50S ribosomal protein L35 [Desulfotomaculum sp.]
MPKIKSHRGAAKRIKRTASGKFKAFHAFRSHLLVHKSSHRKRRLRKSILVSPVDIRKARRLLPS